MHNLILYIYVLAQELPPLLVPQKSAFREMLDTVGSIVTPVAAIALVVAIAYFFWHSKNREELTKAEAEAKALANTRGEKIKDLTAELTDVKALNVELNGKLAAAELLDEKRAKTEFRLRAEIAELERKLNVGGN